MTTDNTQGLNEITSDLWVKYGRPGTMDEFVSEARQAILDWHNRRAAEALWGLHEYMSQFPDDLNLATMYERIKEMTEEYNGKKEDEGSPSGAS